MNLIKSTLFAAASLMMLSAAQADSPKVEKIATVDVQKIFKDYYKTHEAQKDLTVDEKAIQEKNVDRMEKIKALEKELTDMQKKAADSSMSDDAKKKMVETFNLKQADYVSLQKEREEFLNRSLKSLNTKKEGKMRVIIEEIYKTVDAAAAKGEFDLVLDKSATSAVGTKVVMFAKGNLDVTEAILKDLNKDAPEGFDPAKTETPAAPAPTPAQ